MKPGLKARGSTGFRGDRVSRVKKPLTRKERRRQERHARKQRTAIFHSRNKTSVDYLTRNGQNTRKIKKKLQKSGAADVGISKIRTQAARAPEEKVSTSSKVRSMESQSLAMAREEKEIARLEKLLRMKRRKKLPATFKDEGLDCIPFIKCTTPAPTNYDYDHVSMCIMVYSCS